jgi:hypothetical protein
VSGVSESNQPAQVQVHPSAQSPTHAAEVHCSNCNRRCNDAYYRIFGRLACPECTQAIARIMDKNRFAAGPWLRGALAGFGAAVGFAVIWALLAKATGFRGGLVAIFIGIFVSMAVLKASGGRRGPSMQLLAIGLSLFGIWVGKGLCATWVFYDQLAPELFTGRESEPVQHLVLFALGFLLMLGPADLLWYGFAIYDGWRRPRALRIPIEGPFTVSGASERGALQFDSAEFVPGQTEPRA